MSFAHLTQSQFDFYLLCHGRQPTGLAELQLESALRLHDAQQRLERNLLRTLWSAPGLIEGDHLVSAFIPEIQSELQRRVEFIEHMKCKIAETYKDRLDLIEQRQRAFEQEDARDRSVSVVDMAGRP